MGNRPRPRMEGKPNPTLGGNRVGLPAQKERIIPKKLGDGRGEAAKRLLRNKLKRPMAGLSQ